MSTPEEMDAEAVPSSWAECEVCGVPQTNLTYSEVVSHDPWGQFPHNGHKTTRSKHEERFRLLPLLAPRDRLNKNLPEAHSVTNSFLDQIQLRNQTDMMQHQLIGVAPENMTLLTARKFEDELLPCTYEVWIRCKIENDPEVRASCEVRSGIPIFRNFCSELLPASDEQSLVIYVWTRSQLLKPSYEKLRESWKEQIYRKDPSISPDEAQEKLDQRMPALYFRFHLVGQTKPSLYALSLFEAGEHSDGFQVRTATIEPAPMSVGIQRCFLETQVSFRSPQPLPCAATSVRLAPFWMHSTSRLISEARAICAETPLPAEEAGFFPTASGLGPTADETSGGDTEMAGITRLTSRKYKDYASSLGQALEYLYATHSSSPHFDNRTWLEPKKWTEYREHLLPGEGTEESYPVSRVFDSLSSDLIGNSARHPLARMSSSNFLQFLSREAIVMIYANDLVQHVHLQGIEVMEHHGIMLNDESGEDIPEKCLVTFQMPDKSMSGRLNPRKC
jgi:hypothetical protein